MSHFVPGRLDQRFFKRQPTGSWDRRRGGPKGQPFLLRRARRFEEETRHTDGRLYQADDAIPCTCHDLVTHEGDLDATCRYCDGMGYLWDELYFIGYLSFSASLTGSMSTDIQWDSSPGTVNLNEPFLYTYHYMVMRQEDWIVRVAMDMDGNLMQKPIEPQNVYRILHFRPMRMDFARTEYWKYKLRRVYP